jgi:hypothetical protein
MELVERFKTIGSSKQVISLEGLKCLGQLLKYMLTAIIHEKDINFKVIHSVLNVSQLLFFKEYTQSTDQNNNRQYKILKKYLFELINDHGIWGEEAIWKNVLQKVITFKFQEAVTKEQERRAALDGNESGDGQSIMKNAAGFLSKSMKNVWGSGGHDDGKKDKKKNTMRIHKSLAQNIIFNTISNFLVHFVNYQVEYHQSKDVVLYFCKKYELD